MPTGGSEDPNRSSRNRLRPRGAIGQGPEDIVERKGGGEQAIFYEINCLRNVSCINYCWREAAESFHFECLVLCLCVLSPEAHLDAYLRRCGPVVRVEYARRPSSPWTPYKLLGHLFEAEHRVHGRRRKGDARCAPPEAVSRTRIRRHYMPQAITGSGVLYRITP